jgi:iron complex outermembrane receptor protein
VANLTLLARELRPGLEISASVYNLLDRRYGYAGAPEHLQAVIPQDGRVFLAKLTYRF